jgi:hypothetical protein
VIPPCGRLCPRHTELLGQVQFGEDAADVRLDGPRGQDEPVGDRLVRAAFGHQREHLALAVRQGGQRVAPWPAGEQLVDVAGLPGHLEAGVGQEPGDPLAEQCRVVREDDLHWGAAAFATPVRSWRWSGRTGARRAVRG